MTKNSAEHLPPYVIKDPETGDLKVPLKTLPEGLFRAILADSSRDTTPVNSEAWYKLRQAVLALRIVRLEAEEGSKGAAKELNNSFAWITDMPADWVDYLAPYFQREV